MAIVDATEVRQLRQRTTTSKTVKICYKVSPMRYETQFVLNMVANAYIMLGQAVRGNCQNGGICNKLCTTYGSYKVSNNTCTCIQSTPSTNGTVVVPPTCGSNAELNMNQTSCQCKSGYEGNATLGCTEIIKTVFCSNPYGNPCGPNSACTDTPTGISCSPTNLETCPNGCDLYATCINSGTNGYQCECNTGYYRAQPYLPCQVIP